MASDLIDVDKGFKKFFKDLKVFDKVEGQIGIPEDLGSIAVDGDFNLLGLAIVHEFGYPENDGSRIPERSYLRSTFDKNREKYGKAFEEAAKKVTGGKSSAFAEMAKMAEVIRADVIKRIRNKDIVQNLSPVTVERKGSSVALLDTGRLVGSIQARVKNKP